MPKHLSAEVLKLRDNLPCNHCGHTFKGSDSQAFKVKYENTKVYCSDICRKTALSARFTIPLPSCGPCRNCGKEFFSRNTAKQFCSIDCYVASDQFNTMITSNRHKIADAKKPRIFRKWSFRPAQGAVFTPVPWTDRAGQNAARKLKILTPCLECGTLNPPKKTKRLRKYCNRTCQRSYMAKRFDRWVANPETIALPQCYDEFLDQKELPCLIDGCGWSGLQLSLHMNLSHGVPAAELKRAAGFNQSSGLVARPLAEVLRARQNVGVGLAENGYLIGLAAIAERERLGLRTPAIRGKSLEGKEHWKKARALNLVAGTCPTRTCKGCGTTFEQSTPYGRALYCTFDCRDAHYSHMKKKPHTGPRQRNVDGSYAPHSSQESQS